MHKVFISYHHANDQAYKEHLLALNDYYSIFIDASVDTGDIDEDLSDDSIRQKIRDDYLRDSTVTIVLVGTETRLRKHIDWEIFSSMYDGAINKRSGILVIQLPSTNPTYFYAAHQGEKENIYPEIQSWVSIDTRAEFERRHPYLPDRIIDNLVAPGVYVSVANWKKIEEGANCLQLLIDAAFNDRAKCQYDLSRNMRRANS